MSGNSTGHVLGAATSVPAGITVLPYTSGNIVMHIFVLSIIGIGALVFTSFTLSRLYRKFAR